MMQKHFSTVLLILFVAVTGYAANSDNVTPLTEGNKPSPSNNSSYFEGVWDGSWPNFSKPSESQSATITIDRGDKEGTFRITYAYGAINHPTMMMPAGSFKTRGSVQGDKLIFKWKNKQGREMGVILQKHTENEVKARFERYGTIESWERPYNETILNRK